MPFARNRLVLQGATPSFHVRRGVRRQYLGGLNLGLGRNSRTDGYGIREPLFNLPEIFANNNDKKVRLWKLKAHNARVIGASLRAS